MSGCHVDGFEQILWRKKIVNECRMTRDQAINKKIKNMCVLKNNIYLTCIYDIHIYVMYI